MRSDVAGSSSGGFSRRSLLQRLGAAGTGLGIGMLGWLPPARYALASHPNGEGYQIISGCPAYADGHNCLPGCGPSTIYGDACIPEAPHIHWGWHKGSGYGADWMLRPNQCHNGVYDGWVWHYHSPCSDCPNSITRRCHDGYKRISGNWVPSICRWRTACS